MNREVRRALERAGKTAPKRPARHIIPINPLFALDVSARNRLAATERKALDAILGHCATEDDVSQVETICETAIRAITIAKSEAPEHLDMSALDQALESIYKAARAMRKARARHDASGTYGLDAADRQSVIDLDFLIAEMRKPGVITRRVWIKALRDSMSGQGVRIPA